MVPFAPTVKNLPAFDKKMQICIDLTLDFVRSIEKVLISDRKGKAPN